jgi:aspartyl-tRNA(Asn)/glutamyl-tRNA(Gln) amidotransferase subunit C
MSFDRSDVEKIAHLARIAVDHAQIDGVTGDLSNILDLVAEMDAVSVDKVTPMAHPLQMAQRLRVDEVTETDQRDRFQAIAPSAESGLYLVPRVVE